MIVAGIILLLIYYLLPDIVPTVPPGILHVAWVLGWVAIVAGVLLFLFGHFGNRSVGGRRYWW